MTSPSETDFLRTTLRLFRLYENGERDTAFAEFHARHAAQLRRSVALRLGTTVRELHDVDDVLQETFLAAWQYVDRGGFTDLDSVGGFRRLLVKIAMQKVCDAGRQQARQAAGGRQSLQEEHTLPPAPSELPLAAEERLQRLHESALVG